MQTCACTQTSDFIATSFNNENILIWTNKFRDSDADGKEDMDGDDINNK